MSVETKPLPIENILAATGRTIALAVVCISRGNLQHEPRKFIGVGRCADCGTEFCTPTGDMRTAEAEIRAWRANHHKTWLAGVVAGVTE